MITPSKPRRLRRPKPGPEPTLAEQNLQNIDGVICAVGSPRWWEPESTPVVGEAEQNPMVWERTRYA